MRRAMRSMLLTLGLAAVAAVPARAGITVYEQGDKKVEIGGRIQLLYVNLDPDCPDGVPCLIEDSGTTSSGSLDDLVFRRLRPYIAASINRNWMGKIEFDFGEAEDADEVQLKDAYFARTGFANRHSRLSVGSDKTVFSREFLNSSAELDLVERGFTGDHNFGTPERALGIRWDSALRDGKVSYSVNAGSESHDPAVNRIDFDTPVNGSGDWNQGWVAAGRVDFHPLGYQKFSQADFGRGPSKVTIGFGAFVWSNDDDNNSYTDPLTGLTTSTTKVDLDQAQGFEVSVAYRGHGLSIDTEYQRVSADTVDPTFTGGVYRDGTTDLDKLSFTGGYMLAKDFFEVVVGWDSQDADNYQDKYERTSVGLNWYLDKHNLKFQLAYRMVDNFIGIVDQSQNVLFGSAQFKF